MREHPEQMHLSFLINHAHSAPHFKWMKISLKFPSRISLSFLIKSLFTIDGKSFGCFLVKLHYILHRIFIRNQWKCSWNFLGQCLHYAFWSPSSKKSAENATGAPRVKSFYIPSWYSHENAWEMPLGQFLKASLMNPDQISFGRSSLSSWDQFLFVY